MKRCSVLCFGLLLVMAFVALLVSSCSRGTAPSGTTNNDTLATTFVGPARIVIIRSSDMVGDTIFHWQIDSTLYVVLPLNADYIPNINESIVDSVVWSDHNGVDYYVSPSGVLHITVYIDVGDLPWETTVVIDTIYTSGYSTITYDIEGSTVYVYVYIDTSSTSPPPPPPNSFTIRVYYVGNYASQVPNPYPAGPRLGTTLTSNGAWQDGLDMLRAIEPNYTWYYDCRSIASSDHSYLINFKLSDAFPGYWAITMDQQIGAVRAVNLDTSSEIVLSRPRSNGIGRGANYNIVVHSNGQLSEPL